MPLKSISSSLRTTLENMNVPEYADQFRIPFIIFCLTFTLFFLPREVRLSGERIKVGEDLVLYLEERVGLDEMVPRLAELDISFSEPELRWAANLYGLRNFNPGRYEISGSWSYYDLLYKLVMGLQDPALVTVLPGTTVERLAGSLGNQLRADSSAFNAIFSDSSSLVNELGTDPQTLFSRMLPDSYHMYWTSQPESVIRRIYGEFERRVASEWQGEISNHPLDLDDLVTVASIIEWEARFEDEKPRIGGLYLNRLNRRMRLQADPTVIYAIGEHRRLLYEDYNVDHPYNTYRISGLPPTPITNPDLASIRAAIAPEEHDYLYMVASPDGGHVFNRTFEEHRLASNEWRRWIREQFRIRQERERLQEEPES